MPNKIYNEIVEEKQKNADIKASGSYMMVAAGRTVTTPCILQHSPKTLRLNTAFDQHVHQNSVTCLLGRGEVAEPSKETKNRKY